jgi:hypothetical protein
MPPIQILELSLEYVMLDKFYAALLSMTGVTFGGYILLDEVARSVDSRSPEFFKRDDATAEPAALER